MSTQQSVKRSLSVNLSGGKTGVSRGVVIAIILSVALFAFEIFNFDTTQYALRNLLGEVRFAGVLWATILAIAFCAIDFAGLVRIVTPEKGREEPKVVWFLMGAWFLGTMANAVMTWWAVSLTLLNHDFGNEVLSREQLLRYVPIFVAALVWLTRILFIGAFSVAGEEMLDKKRGGGTRKSTARPVQAQSARTTAPRPATHPKPRTAAPKSSTSARTAAPPPSAPPVTYEPIDDPVMAQTPPVTNSNANTPPSRTQSRIRQRPPVPNGSGRMPRPSGVQARPNGAPPPQNRS